MQFDEVKEHRKLQLQELEEIHREAYDTSKSYKDKMKELHNQFIQKKEFKQGEKVLLFNAKLRLFPGKLRSRWSGPFLVTKVYDHGAIEIQDLKTEKSFKVNGHRLKHYYEPFDSTSFDQLILKDPSATT